jgi:hypothetical protein
MITAGNLTKTDGSATLTATGNITVGNLNTSGSIKANSTAGYLTVGTAATVANVVGGSSEFKAAGDITLGSLSAHGGATVASSGGSVYITSGFSGNGTITAATDINIGISTNAKASTTTSIYGLLGGSQNGSGAINAATVLDAGGGYTPSSTIALTFAAAPAGGVRALGYGTTNSSGQLSGIVITDAGAGYTANPAITITPNPTNAVVAGGALTMTATNGSVTIGAPVVASTSSLLDIKSAQSLAVPQITAQALNLTSTGGSITQTAAVVASGTTTINAAADATLDNVGNDFGTVVLLNSPLGITLTDANALTIGNTTVTKGNVAITSGAGLTSVANATALTISNPIPAQAAGMAVNTATGQVTDVTIRVGGGGYTPSSSVALTFSAPPANAAPATITIPSTAANVTGYVLAGGKLGSVVLKNPIGNGYLPSTEVAVTINDGGVPAAGYTAIGVVNGNGQIASIKVTAVGGVIIGAPSVTFAAPTAAAATQATGYANANASGVIRRWRNRRVDVKNPGVILTRSRTLKAMSGGR